MAPSRHDWKIVDRDVKPQHNQPTFLSFPLWKDKFKWYVAVTRDNDVDNLIELKETLRG